MNHQDLINTCVFELFQGLLFSDLSGPLILEQLYTVKYLLVKIRCQCPQDVLSEIGGQGDGFCTGVQYS